MHVCAADGDLRLVGGASESPGTASAAEYGRLQIFSSGGWGVVCDDELQQDYSGFADVVDARFTEAAVGVACRQLGFTSGEKVILAVRTPLAPLGLHAPYALQTAPLSNHLCHPLLPCNKPPSRARGNGAQRIPTW